MNKVEKYILGIIIIVMLCGFFIKYVSHDNLINNSHYTLGEVTKKESDRLGYAYTIQFKVNNEFYVKEISQMGVNLKVKNLVFVQFQTNNPDNSDVLFNINVPGCFHTNDAPVLGWRILPKDTCYSK